MATTTSQTPLPALAERLEAVELLDAPGQAIGKAVRSAIKPGALKDLLSGTAIGHAVHPLLTDVVIGSWTSASLLDLLGGRSAGPAAERLVAIGIAAYPVTALTGVTDWADAEYGDPGARRVGLIHAATNSVALGLYGASLRARRSGSRGRGALLGLAGLGVVSAAGYLGAHMTYVEGVGVDQTAFDPGPADWTAATAADRVAEGGKPTAVDVAGTPVMLVRQSGAVLALHDRCSHRGCLLSAMGELEPGAITCTCHGSRFSLADGSVLRGPATAPQPTFETRERAGQLEIRLRA